MNYTSATRGHWIVALGSIVVVGSTFLQWWQVGGGPGELPQSSGMGISDGRTFLMFLIGVITLLLVTLPFASERPISIDHPITYLALFVATLATYIWRAAEMVTHSPASILPLPPQRGIGFWIAAFGLALLSRGVFEVYEERRRRLY
ncbi:MAG TPA: hypothetical protein VF337_07885 [Candidatus Limnocylindrales bacterium]